MLFSHGMGRAEGQAVFEMVKTANQITDNLVAAIKTSKDILGAIDVSALKQSYDEAITFLQRQEAEKKLEEKFAAILCKANWPPCLDLTNDGIMSIVDEYDKTADFFQFKGELDKALIDYYNVDVLAEKLTSWNTKSFIARRIPILTKVVEAHHRKDYLLSVPVMLAQTEGVIAEGKGHIGQLRQKEIKDYLDILYRGHILESLSSSMKDFVSTEVFTGFEWGSPLTASLSRNAILHGADTNYGTEINSLKALLLFDFIVFSFELKP